MTRNSPGLTLLHKRSLHATMTGPYTMEDTSTEEEYALEEWMTDFCSKRGNEYFCRVDSEFILDRFNLTGLGHDIPHAQEAYELITDKAVIDEEDYADQHKQEVMASAKLLYGMIHARYIITANGLNAMRKKYVSGEFGTCPRVLCNAQLLVPVGLSDLPRIATVKLYCCHCEDVYNPKSSAHNAIDGAYFGTTFPHLFFQSFPHLRPARSEQVYVPKIFGFRIAGEESLGKFKSLQEQRRTGATSTSPSRTDSPSNTNNNNDKMMVINVQSPFWEDFCVPSRPSTQYLEYSSRTRLSSVLLLTDGRVKDVASFLGRIRRGCESYVTKFPTWESLFTMDGAAMEAAGIQCRQRKMILRWAHKYRQGIEPYYIRPSIKSRLKAKTKRKAAASTGHK